MKRTIRLLAAPAAALLLLSACSGTPEDTAPADADAPVAEVDEGAEEKETEVADGGEGDTTTDELADGWPVVEPGEWGSYDSAIFELPKGAGEIDVRIAEHECGVTSLDDAVSNPEYVSSGGEQGAQYIPAEAATGKEFCVFTMDLKNVGSTPYQADAPGGILLENGDYHEQSSEDQDISWTIQETHLGESYVMDLNPGDEVQYLHVVSIPEGSTPAELFYPQETMVSGPVLSLLIGE